MTGESEVFAVHRLVVATGAAGSRAPTFARAAELAATLGVDLAGLLVEDQNLLRAATLPVARYVSGLVGAAGLDAPALEAELRALAARTRAAVGEAARHAGVAWSFTVLRGDPAAEIARATGPGDLLVVGPESDIAGRALRAGESLRDAAGRAARSVLLTRDKPRQRRSLAVANLGSPLIERVVAAAARLARPVERELDILTIGSGDFERLERSIAAMLAGRGIRARLQRTDEATVRRLAEAAASSRSDLMVVASDVAPLSDDGTRLLLESSDCEILVIR